MKKNDFLGRCLRWTAKIFTNILISEPLTSTYTNFRGNIIIVEENLYILIVFDFPICKNQISSIEIKGIKYSGKKMEKINQTVGNLIT